MDLELLLHCDEPPFPDIGSFRWIATAHVGRFILRAPGGRGGTGSGRPPGSLPLSLVAY